jgi:hypothetical protein
MFSSNGFAGLDGGEDGAGHGGGRGCLHGWKNRGFGW